MGGRRSTYTIQFPKTPKVPSLSLAEGVFSPIPQNRPPRPNPASPPACNALPSAFGVPVDGSRRRADVIRMGRQSLRGGVI
jgi:hypothetical protein